MDNSANLKLAMLFQLLTRMLTFLMNNLIARNISATNLGLITLKLDLLGNTVMALGRDGIRMAILREKSSEERRKSRWLTPILVTFIGILCSGIVVFFTKEPVILANFDHFQMAVACYFTATVLESLTEFSVTELIISQQFKRKILIESMALIMKISFVLYSISMRPQVQLSTLLDAFSRGQLIYSVSLNILHFFLGAGFDKNFNFSSFPSQKFINLASALTRQNLFKYFLAQGDLFIIGYFSSLRDQGVYAVISNYGSLVLRLVMQPIEETSFQYFSRNAAGNDKNVLVYFKMMLKSLIYFGLLFICFGTFFTDPVIFFLLGRKWSSETAAADTLSAYCWFVAVAGLSGFMESFVNAVIEEEGMRRLRWISFVCSLIYCCLAIGLIRWKGSVGLVMASSINFGIRAAINASIIQDHRRTKKETRMNRVFKDVLIPASVLAAFSAAFLLNSVLFILRRPDWKLRISVGILLFTTCSGTVAKKDMKFLREFQRHWHGKKNKQ